MILANKLDHIYKFSRGALFKRDDLQRKNEAGNVLFIILLAVVLIGLLTAALQSSNNSQNANIDKETFVIRQTEIQRHAAELERAVHYILQNGASESDIRFAHPNANVDYGDLSADPDPSDQVFHPSGGAANYRLPPSGINDGSLWEFYGSTHIPGMGTGRAELIAVLPNVTQSFCDQINKANDQNGVPTDTGTCLYDGATSRFDGGTQFSASPNTVDEATFEQDASASAAYPARQACVACGAARHFYHVLLAR